jgi:hypothetical protein
MANIRVIRIWERWLLRVKLLPLVLAGVVSVILPLPLVLRVFAGTLLYVFLYCITWRRADGSRAFPPYIW